MDKIQTSWHQRRWTYEDSLERCPRMVWITVLAGVYAGYRALTSAEKLHHTYWFMTGLLLLLALIWGYALPSLLRWRIARRDRKQK